VKCSKRRTIWDRGSIFLCIVIVNQNIYVNENVGKIT